MGKKSLTLPSLFKPQKKHQWPQIIPSCGFSPKTLSFRAGVGVGVGAGDGDDIFKTVNSVFFDPIDTSAAVEIPDPWFTTSSESAASFTTESDGGDVDGEVSVETVVRGVRSSAAESERLFFDPDETRSILASIGCPFKESEVLAMESEDPYCDFRRSMEEMVESQGVRDWEGLEELLGWYLRVNGKKNHGFIIGAFVDLLVSLASNNHISHPSNSDSTITTSSSTSYSSALSSFSSFSPLLLPHK